MAKLVKYLPAFGWQPTVLTVEPAGYFAYDDTLLAEVEAAGVRVVRTKSWDPTRLFGKKETIRLPKESSRRKLSSLSQALFVPDNKRGWQPFAVPVGKHLLKDDQFDVIYSTAPPYTAHLIGAKLARWSKLPFVADFRDDWVGNPRHEYMTAFHRAWSLRLERHVVQSSVFCTVINEPIQLSLMSRHRSAADIRIVTQGFDPVDFDNHTKKTNNEKMRFLYTGVFYDVQTPDFFLRGLVEALERAPAMRTRIEARFVGLVPEASKELATTLLLDEVVTYKGYLDHRETVNEQAEADVLWLMVGRREGAEQISTGKLYEYIGARKPIFAMVPNGAARQTAEAYGASFIVPPNDVDRIATEIIWLYTLWDEGKLPQPDDHVVQRYNRKEIAGQVAAQLDACVVGK